MPLSKNAEILTFTLPVIPTHFHCSPIELLCLFTSGPPQQLQLHECCHLNIESCLEVDVL